MGAGPQAIVLGAFFGLALVLVVAGAIRVALPALAVKKRVDALKNLPILATIADTQKRLATTQRNVESLDALLARARAALDEIQAAGDRVAKIGRTLVFVVRAIAAIAGGSRATNRPAPPA